MRALLLALVMTLPAIVQAKEISIGMKFRTARKLLITEAWQPVDVHAGEAYEYMGTETALAKANIHELESCAMDRPLCIFNYRKGEACLRLVTEGEHINSMRVRSWTSDCPDMR
jgi:hypothetical protein